MNPKKNELKSKSEFPGSAGKGKLPCPCEVNKPKSEFPGSAGKGSLPKGNHREG
jgi:hypothetical protein